MAIIAGKGRVLFPEIDTDETGTVEVRTPREFDFEPGPLAVMNYVRAELKVVIDLKDPGNSSWPEEAEVFLVDEWGDVIQSFRANWDHWVDGRFVAKGAVKISQYDSLGVKVKVHDPSGTAHLGFKAVAALDIELPPVVFES